MKKIYSLFIGRWQPLHDGHKKLMQVVLDEGRNVLVGIRDTEITDKNPYSAEQREVMIREAFPDTERVKIIILPDIEEVVHGREVGWGVRELKLDAETELISGTKIRNANNLKVDTVQNI